MISTDYSTVIDEEGNTSEVFLVWDDTELALSMNRTDALKLAGDLANLISSSRSGAMSDILSNVTSVDEVKVGEWDDEDGK